MARKIKQKVFVAMSGGVDSSVAAALLKKQGYEVVGVFIKIEVIVGCDWREERRDARRAAAVLKVPLLTFDLSAEYRQSVIDYLVREYRAGRTPNPDVRCNKEIKFGVFFNEARKHGADFIATGHYVLKQDSKLLIAKDKNKDQSYFLWAIKSAVLEYCLFPIGDYKKSQVRRLARKFGLPNADKPDSQGLCFLGPIDFKEFLAKYLPPKPGLVINEEGEEIGHHRGAHFYTIGERHGFTLFKQRPDISAHYIVAKDITLNILTAAPSPKLINWSLMEIELQDLNWIADPPIIGKTYLARTRYRAPLVPCRIKDSKVIFNEPQTAIAPGQSCVLYDGERCLGGGVIIYRKL